MFENYDLKTRNPYGAKLSTQALNPDGAFKAVSIAIPAGLELANHTSPNPAMLFMIEGKATFSSDAGKIAMTPGTVVHIPPSVAHRIDAIADSHFVLVR